MNCPSCGRSNRPAARFCGGCGASLAPRCPACGASGDPGASYCDACGAALAAPVGEKAIARKVVTVVFADLIGSVALHERLDAESARRETDRYHRAMTAAVEVHGGRVVQLLGDGVLAAFGVPRVAEDDAIRAVRAAVGMQRAFRELVRERGRALEGVGLRVAVNTGEVVVSDDETAVIGDPTNVAARLQQEARDGDVLLGEGTQRLVADLVTLAPLGSFALKGRTESVAAYRVVSLEQPASLRATPFVGRDDELRRLGAVLEAAVAARAGRLAVLLGSPGLGKSRLLAELARRAGERATVLSARCDAAGGATFAPIAEVLRALLRLEEGAGADVLRAAIDAVAPGDDAERARIAAGIGALFSGAPASPEETFFAVRRLLAALAAVRPVVLAIDDLQWAEPLLLDLVEHLVQWSTDAPLLVLVAARPELREARSSLATPGPLVADVVTLGGLDASASMRLAAGVVGGSELPAALVGRVLATSEGNPLFLAELVRMLVQDGTLRREGERWVTTVEVSKLDMPPTIGVLLAARIERLRPEERSVLERAAVVGRQFSRAAVAQLLPGGAGELDARLEALRRSELIEPDPGWFLGEPALRFHHVLIRDAAYRRVLKETRAELHERLADWIDERVGDAPEHEETLGWHLEQAHRNLRELGPLEARGRALGERAARHLGSAGRRALSRDDLALASGLLGRALDALEPGHPARAELAPDWCEALLAAGEVGTAARAVEELDRCAGESARLRAWHACFAAQLAGLTDPQSLRATAASVAAAATALAAAHDAAGEAKAHSVHAGVLARLGEVGASETALDKALAAARRARDRRRANAVLAGAPVAALWGPSPVTRASGRCLDVVRVLRITQGAPAVEAVALRCQAVLEALRGRVEPARRMIASSRRMLTELGIAQQLLEADVFAGLIELLDGEAEAAEPHLRSAYEGLRQRGLGIDAARAAALLGRALLALGRAADAEALSRESEALAGDDLQAAMGWRGVRAQALAGRGEHGEGLALAREAVAIAARTDDLLDHADARVALAVALRAAGRAAEADGEERRAVELWEAKGATLLVERARQRAASAGASAQSRRARPGPQEAAGGGRSRRIHPNHATAHIEQLDAAIAARDQQAVARLCAPEIEVLHRPTGTTYGYDAAVARFGPAFRQASGFSARHDAYATLGDAMALCRVTTASGTASIGELDVGAFEIDYHSVIEADAAARSTRVEVFAAELLGDAVVRLYERHAERLPAGAERDRATAVARAVAAVVRMDADAIAGVLAPDIAFSDHRTLGVGSSRGAERYLRGLRGLLELAADTSSETVDVLAASEHGLLLRRRLDGVDRRTGGPFELHLLMLWTFDEAGRVSRVEFFDVEASAAAFARLDALLPHSARGPAAARDAHDRAPAASPEPPFANAAWRAAQRSRRAWNERDWDAAVACRAPGMVQDDRRALVGVVLSGDELLANMRVLFGARSLQLDASLLATRGERLSMQRVSMQGVFGGGGPVAYEFLSIVEVDREGLITRLTMFDTGQLDAAHAELDARFAAGEGAAHASFLAWRREYARAWRGRDLDAIAPLADAGFTQTSHRRFASPGVVLDRSAWLASHAATGGLGIQNEEFRLEHLRLSRRAALSSVRWTGERDGGAFEVPLVFVDRYDAERGLLGQEVYDLEQLDAARARFAALSGDGVRPHVDTAATRAAERFAETFRARDVAGLAALLATDFMNTDRRSITATELDRAAFLASFGPILDLVKHTQASHQVLATRGQRLALVLFCVQLTGFDGSDAGPSEIEFLQVLEVDSEGRIAAGVGLEAADRAAGWAELDARYHAGEAAPFARVTAGMRAFHAAFAARDWDALAAQCAPDIVVNDHRRLGWESLHGRDSYVAALRALVELAPDTRLRLDHVELDAGRYLVITVWEGTREGGPFEEPSWMVAELDGEGRVRRFDQYDLQREDAARARYEEIARSAADPVARWLRPT